MSEQGRAPASRSSNSQAPEGDQRGLTAAERALYDYLLAHPGTDSRAVADAFEVSRDAATGWIDRLVSRGLVRRSPGGSDQLQVAPPDLTLHRLLVAEERALQQLREYVHDATERYRQLHRPSPRTPDVIEVLTGQDVLPLLDELLDTAEREVCATDLSPWPVSEENLNEPNQVEVKVLARGVTCRCVYDQSALQFPGRWQHILAMTEAGEKARLAAGVPVKLLLVDSRIAVLIGVTDTVEATIVRPSLLLTALVGLFELLWARAIPVSVTGRLGNPDGTELDRSERLLLMMLESGLTDEAIGRQLGVSHRTVTRRVRELMDRLGAVNRFQAGLLAYARGWVAGPEDRR